MWGERVTYVIDFYGGNANKPSDSQSGGVVKLSQPASFFLDVRPAVSITGDGVLLKAKYFWKNGVSW